MEYRGFVEAVDCSVARWHRGEAGRGWRRRAADVKSYGKGKRYGGGRGTDSTVDEGLK